MDTDSLRHRLADLIALGLDPNRLAHELQMDAGTFAAFLRDGQGVIDEDARGGVACYLKTVRDTVRRIQADIPNGNV